VLLVAAVVAAVVPGWFVVAFGLLAAALVVGGTGATRQDSGPVIPS
jgi:hypothetical protein